MYGTIARMNQNGFCFITCPGRPDVFCHASNLEDLAFNDSLVSRQVEFEIEVTDRGPRAVRVRPA